MSISFPVLPSIPSLSSLTAGLPSVQSFPGAASLIGSINGTVAQFSSGVGSVAAGLSLSGLGVAPGTVLTSGLTAIQNGIGFANVNISQIVPNISMLATGSLGDLLGNVTELLDGDTVSAVLGSGGTQWGVYLDGAPALLPDSIIAVDYKKDWHIADYPIEKGNFETYNKVRLPYEARVTMTKGGSEAERGAFLQAVENVADALDLYDVVTPEITYTNSNVAHFDYRRTSSEGAGLLTVTLWLQEIRVEASSAFTQTAAPSAADQLNIGNVQTKVVTAIEQKIFQGHGATGSF